MSSFCFGLYVFFLIDFFLHISARIPAYGAVRPTVLLVALISISLFSQQNVLKGRSKNESFKAISVLLVYSFLALPFVEWPGSVLKNNIPVLVKAVVFLFFTGLIVDSLKRLKITVFVFVLCQTFRVLEPLFLHFSTGYWGSKTHLGGGEFAQRLAGAPSDVINSNELGFVIATVMPFMYYFLWRGKFKNKIVFMLLAPLMVYALVLTMSRGAMIALLVVGWLIFKESKRKGIMIAVLVSALILVWSVLSPVQKDRYLSLVDSEAAGSSSAQGRFNGMLNEFKLAMERPVFGHGIGTTAEAKYHLFGKVQASHNLYAEVLIEIGVIGGVIFLWYIKSIIHALRSIKRRLLREGAADPFYVRLNYALTALFWMYAVYSINYMGLTVYYWYMLGGLVVCFDRMILNDPRVGNKEGVGGKLNP